MVLRYLPEVSIAVVAGHERNMKVTEPIDVYIADKLFQLTSADRPAPLTDEQYHARLDGRTVVIFGGSYGIGGDIAQFARKYGADVKTFSRSTTGTFIENASRRCPRRSAGARRDGPHRFRGQPPGVLVRGELAETSEETIYSSTDVNYLAPIFVAQEFFPIWLHPAAHCCCSPRRLTPAAAQAIRCTPRQKRIVNLTQALADEWASSGVRVNCVNPERTGTPMRTKAFSEEPPDAAVIGAGCPSVPRCHALPFDGSHHRHPPRGRSRRPRQ